MQFIKCLAKKVNQDELEEKVARMRILENVELPESSRKTLLPDKKPIKPESPTEVIKTKEKTEMKMSLGEENIDIKAKIEDRDEVRKSAIAKTEPAKPEVLVRMANLSVIAVNKVNGVAAIHSEIVKNEVFKDFYKVIEACSACNCKLCSRDWSVWRIKTINPKSVVVIFESAMAGKIPEQNQWSNSSTLAGILQPWTERRHHQMAGQSGLDPPYWAPGWPSQGWVPKP